MATTRVRDWATVDYYALLCEHRGTLIGDWLFSQEAFGDAAPDPDARMLDELAIARGDGRLARLLASWARISVLVIDDLLLRPLTSEQAADLLEVIEDRAGLRATIITSQLPVTMWHQAIADPTIADAALDRLLSSTDRIELTGESMRRAPATGPGRRQPEDRS